MSTHSLRLTPLLALALSVGCFSETLPAPGATDTAIPRLCDSAAATEWVDGCAVWDDVYETGFDYDRSVTEAEALTLALRYDSFHFEDACVPVVQIDYDRHNGPGCDLVRGRLIFDDGTEVLSEIHQVNSMWAGPGIITIPTERLGSATLEIVSSSFDDVIRRQIEIVPANP